MAKAKRRGPTLNQRSRRVSSAEKAAFHNLAGGGKLPMRAFVGNTDREIDELVRMLQARIDAKVK